MTNAKDAPIPENVEAPALALAPLHTEKEKTYR
jgi:hypothetical protein